MLAIIMFRFIYQQMLALCFALTILSAVVPSLFATTNDVTNQETSNLRCEYVECDPAFCHNAIKLDGDCCLHCPYYAPVFTVSTTKLDTVTEGQINSIVFNMTADMNVNGTAIVGKGLWKVGVWASSDAKGNSNKISYTSQVLSYKQAAVPAKKKYDHHESLPKVSLTSIEYELNTTDVICSEMKYLCVQFGRGDNPKQEEPRLPFTVEGVTGINDHRSAPENLIGCEMFKGCNGASGTTTHDIDDDESWGSSDGGGLLPCSYRGTVLRDGQYLTVDECNVCTCDNSTTVCYRQICRIASCGDGQEPVIVDGDCCESCPDSATTVDGTTFKDAEGCMSYGIRIAFGDSLAVSDCTMAYCQSNHILRYEIRSCPSIFCDEPFTLDGECCQVCPYYVPVWKVKLSKPPGITEGQINKLMFNLTVEVNNAGVEFHGRGLWKVSAWTTPSSDGGGKRIGFTEQVLTNNQSDTNLRREFYFSYFGPLSFEFRDIKYTFDASDVSCSEMKYLCVQLARGDAPELHDHRIPFIVEGVAAKYNSSAAAINLRRCRRIATCTETDAPQNTLSFSVARMSSLSAEPESVTIVWNHVFKNAGGALNTNTGIFTCSIAGSYFFIVLIAEPINTRSPVVQFIKNGEVIPGLVARIGQGSTGSADSIGNYVIIDLQINDHIWLQLNQGGEIFGSTERFSKFSGFLIFPS